MPMMFIESGPEFEARHGGKPIRIYDRDGTQTNLGIFPDGATLNYDAPDSTRKEPPTDKWKLLDLKRQYWAEIARRAIEDYETAKRRAMEVVAWAKTNTEGPLPSPELPSLLKKLKHNAEVAELKVKEIEKELENSPSQIERRRREKLRHERLRNLATFEQKIRNVVTG